MGVLENHNRFKILLLFGKKALQWYLQMEKSLGMSFDIKYFWQLSDIFWSYIFLVLF